MSRTLLERDLIPNRLLTQPRPTIVYSDLQAAATTTTHTVSIPAIRRADDVLLYFLSLGAPGAATNPAGWAGLGATYAVAARSIRGFVKIADGTETTATYTSTNSVTSVRLVMVIRHASLVIARNADNTPTAAPLDTVDVSGARIYANLSATSRSLVIGFAHRDGANGINAFPADLPDNRLAVMTGSDRTGAVASGYADVLPFTPGTWGGPSSGEWANTTLLIR